MNNKKPEQIVNPTPCQPSYKELDMDHFEMFQSNLSETTLVFVEHNIGFINIRIPGQTFTCLHAFSPKWQLFERMMAQK